MAWCSIVAEQTFLGSPQTDFSTKVPWTTARCQRLLRPLLSKIALLRKEKQSVTDTEDLRQVYSLAATSDKHRSALNHWSRRRRSEKVNVADEEWAPNPRPAKRIRRTYSSRSSSSQHHDDFAQHSVAEQAVQTQSEITIPRLFFQAKTQGDAEADATASSQSLPLSQQDVECECQPPMRRSEETGGRLLQSQSRRGYASTVSFERKLTSGICKGVETLLRATDEQQASRTGTRSLFSTCLRRVPDYIVREELWNKAEDPESNIDVSSIIYSDLESLGTSETNGWEPLRQVVRAHGIQAVGMAMSEGLIDISICHEITNLCLVMRAYDEAQYLLDCRIKLIEPLHKQSKVSGRSGLTLMLLETSVLGTGRRSFRYKTLARLLDSGRLPLGWISRPETIETWNRVIQSITQQDEHAQAASELLRLATTMTYGPICHDPARFVHGIRLRRSRHLRKANEHILGLGYQTTWPRGSQTAAIDGEGVSVDGKAPATVSSLMTVLCAIGLLRSATMASQSSYSHVPNVSVLQDIASDAQQVLEVASERLFSVRDEYVAVFLLAAGLVKATTCRSRQDFTSTIPPLFNRLTSLNYNGSVVEEGGSFLCAVAECCARGTSEEVFDHTRKIVQHIHHIADSLRPLSTGYELCNRIGVAAALEYAETTQQPKHLHWALEVEQTITGANLESARRTPAKTPSRGQAQGWNGYRWEAGICEWVAKTPAIALQKAQIPEQHKASTQCMGTRSRSVRPCNASIDLESSPCSLSERKSSAHDRHGLRGRRSLRFSKNASSEHARKEVWFSHIYIEGEGDELSACESSQEAEAEAQAEGASPLRAITNTAAKLNQQPAAQEQIPQTYMRYATRRGSLGTEKVHCMRGRVQEQDIALDSEDELSIL